MQVDWANLYKTNDLPKTVAEARAKWKAPYKKYPKLMWWKDLKADVPGFNWVKHEEEHSEWPDETDQWNMEVKRVIQDGHATNEFEAFDHLYKHNSEFKCMMDKLEADRREYCVEMDKKRRMAVFHRAAWTTVWVNRWRRA